MRLNFNYERVCELPFLEYITLVKGGITCNLETRFLKINFLLRCQCLSLFPEWSLFWFSWILHLWIILLSLFSKNRITWFSISIILQILHHFFLKSIIVCSFIPLNFFYFLVIAFSTIVYFKIRRLYAFMEVECPM